MANDPAMQHAAEVMDIAARIFVEARGKVAPNMAIKQATKFVNEANAYFQAVARFIEVRDAEKGNSTEIPVDTEVAVPENQDVSGAPV